MNEKAVPKQASAAPAKKSAEEEEEDEALDLDIGLIQKFGRLNITAPINKQDLPKSLKDLQELKLAFLQKGDEERQNAKVKFLKESRLGRGQEVEEEKVEGSKPEGEKAPEDKLLIVEKIGQLKRSQT